MKDILITGAFGFIGSNLVRFLNERGIIPFVLDTNHGEQWRNVTGLQFRFVHDKTEIPWLGIEMFVHLGANVDTRELMSPQLFDNNVYETLRFRDQAKEMGSRFIYASSAAVYGAEEKDFSERIEGLKPLNAYGFTKLALDSHFFSVPEAGLGTVGLRFFNVYGPNEKYKGEMASVVHKSLIRQAPLYGRTNSAKSSWQLFKSNRSDVLDGEQRRDFVHVFDVCKVIWHFINRPSSGIFNVGSGEARTFNDLVRAVEDFPIEYRSMPATLCNQYQYHTCADLTKLRSTGYNESFLSLEEGIELTKKIIHG